VSTKHPQILPLNCSTCGQPVTLSYTPTKNYQSSNWTCPHKSCLAVHHFELKGKDMKAVARHEMATVPDRRQRD
jgi:hypothetical protein